MRFIDPDGLSSQDVGSYKTKDGTTVSYDVNTQKTLGYDTEIQGGEGDEKDKQGYYPSGVMRPASQQNATIKPTEAKEFGSHFSPEDKVAQKGEGN